MQDSKDKEIADLKEQNRSTKTLGWINFWSLFTIASVTFMCNQFKIDGQYDDMSRMLDQKKALVIEGGKEAARSQAYSTVLNDMKEQKIITMTQYDQAIHTADSIANTNSIAIDKLAYGR